MVSIAKPSVPFSDKVVTDLAIAKQAGNKGGEEEVKFLRGQRLSLNNQLSGLQEEKNILLRSQAPSLPFFKAKLEIHSINRPNAGAMSPLILYFPQQMMMMAQAEAYSDYAMLLYKQALAQPGTQTALKVLTNLHIAVNGPWLASHPSACDRSGFAV
ncbi:TPA: hypothetical protein ACH3X1_003895 [Trebouxia sp. C0004]